MEPDQGEFMKLAVDRPWPRMLTIESGKGIGKEVMVSAILGDNSNPVLLAVEVAVDDLGERPIGKIEGPFDSIEQAEELALKHATDWYDRGNG
jgi:hypothetical protein